MKNELKLLLVTNYLNWFSAGLLSPLYALFVLSLGGTPVEAGLTLGALYLEAGILIIAFGKLGDEKVSKRKMVVAGYFLSAIAFASFYFVESVTHLYFAQFLNALSIGMLFPAWKAVFSSLEDKGREASEWALFDGGNYLIWAIASLAAGFVFNSFGFKGIFLLMAGMQLLGASISLKLLRTQGKANVFVSKNGGKNGRKANRKRR